MEISNIYFGVWFQRTNLHLQELYFFLRDGKPAGTLDQHKAHRFWKELAVSQVEYHEQPAINLIRAKCGDFSISFSEDGLFLISARGRSARRAVSELEAYYEKKFGPAVNYLFSRGAPLPKLLGAMAEIRPMVVVVGDKPKEDTAALFEELDDRPYASVTSGPLTVVTGTHANVLLFSGEEGRRLAGSHESLVGALVFFRDFEEQLHSYLGLHRVLWDSAAAVREAKSLRYRDFPAIRSRMLDNMKTISFVRARLAQMSHILHERSELSEKSLSSLLNALGLNRFAQLDASQKYIVDLWEMTSEYVAGALELLESLTRENTQTEISALKYITLVGAVAGFFGMNIAFPWDESWPRIFSSSLAVVGVIAASWIGFYFLLRWLIYHREFSLRK